MLSGAISKQFKLCFIVCLGLCALYTLLNSPVSSPAVGGTDWECAFCNGARGDYSRVVTPYWSLILSYLPSRFPDPIGYSLWISVGALLVVATAGQFGSPLLLVLLSYQLNWILFYGQIDSYVVFGIALGYHAIRRARPYLLGIAISLLLIKPQIGLLLSVYFLLRSPYRLKTLLAFLSIVLASLILWPGWPERYILEQILSFLDRPYNILTNTSLGLPLWVAMPLAALALLSRTNEHSKIQGLVAANLLLSPYSTIYSQLSLLCLGLPKGFYVFSLIPWAVAIFMGPFGHWRWAFVFPLVVLIYSLAIPGEKWLKLNAASSFRADKDASSNVAQQTVGQLHSANRR